MSRAYRAFISYSHAQKDTARLLHARLEDHIVPDGLPGAGERLAPLFIDEAELGAAKSLTKEILDAIDASSAMIVMCSPQSAQSKWVNDEILHFRNGKPDAPLIAVILAGRVGASDPADECLPPALRFKMRNGAISNEPEDEPRAINLAESGIPKTVLQIAAAIAGKPYGEYFDRHAQSDRFRTDRLQLAIARMYEPAAAKAFAEGRPDLALKYLLAYVLEAGDPARGGNADRAIDFNRAEEFKRKVNSYAAHKRVTWNHRVEDTWCVAISPSGRFVATIVGDTLTVHDTEIGKIAVTLSDYKDFSRVEFSPDSKRLLIHNFGKKLRVIEVPSGTLKWESNDANLNEICWFNDSNRLLSLERVSLPADADKRPNPYHVFVTDISSGAVKHFETAIAYLDAKSIHISENSEWLAISCDNDNDSAERSAVVSLKSKKLAYTLQPYPFLQIAGFSPDSRFLCTWTAVSWWWSDESNCWLEARHARSGWPIWSTKLEIAPTTVAFFPRGDRIATGDTNGKIVFFSWPFLQRMKVLQDRRSPVKSIKVSSDGATISVLYQDSVVQIFDAANLSLVSRHDPNWAIEGPRSEDVDEDIALSSCGSEIVSVFQIGGIYSYERKFHIERRRISTSQELKRFPLLVSWRGNVEFIGATRDFVCVSDGQALRINAAKGQTKWKSNSRFWLRFGRVSPDGNLFAAADRKNRIVLLNCEDGKQQGLIVGHNIYIDALSWSADGQQIISKSENDIRVWDVQSRSLNRVVTVLEYRSDVGAVGLLRDGRAVTAKYGLKAWAFGSEPDAYATISAQIASFLISRDEKRFTLAINDYDRGDFSYIGICGGLRPWDGSITYDLSAVSERFSSKITSLCASPNEELIVLTFEDGFVRVLHSQSLKIIGEYPPFGQVARYASISSDGAMIVVCYESGDIRVFDSQFLSFGRMARLAWLARSMSNGQARLERIDYSDPLLADALTAEEPQDFAQAVFARWPELKDIPLPDPLPRQNITLLPSFRGFDRKGRPILKSDEDVAWDERVRVAMALAAAAIFVSAAGYLIYVVSKIVWPLLGNGDPTP